MVYSKSIECLMVAHLSIHLVTTPHRRNHIHKGKWECVKTSVLVTSCILISYSLVRPQFFWNRSMLLRNGFEWNSTSCFILLFILAARPKFIEISCGLTLLFNWKWGCEEKEDNDRRLLNVMFTSLSSIRCSILLSNIVGYTNLFVQNQKPICWGVLIK